MYLHVSPCKISLSGSIDVGIKTYSTILFEGDAHPESSYPFDFGLNSTSPSVPGSESILTLETHAHVNANHSQGNKRGIFPGDHCDRFHRGGTADLGRTGWSVPW